MVLPIYDLHFPIYSLPSLFFLHLMDLGFSSFFLMPRCHGVHSTGRSSTSSAISWIEFSNEHGEFHEFSAFLIGRYGRYTGNPYLEPPFLFFDQPGNVPLDLDLRVNRGKANRISAVMMESLLNSYRSYKSLKTNTSTNQFLPTPFLFPFFFFQMNFQGVCSPSFKVKKSVLKKPNRWRC